MGSSKVDKYKKKLGLFGIWRRIDKKVLWMKLGKLRSYAGREWPLDLVWYRISFFIAPLSKKMRSSRLITADIFFRLSDRGKIKWILTNKARVCLENGQVLYRDFLSCLLFPILDDESDLRLYPGKTVFAAMFCANAPVTINFSSSKWEIDFTRNGATIGHTLLRCVTTKWLNFSEEISISGANEWRWVVRRIIQGYLI